MTFQCMFFICLQGVNLWQRMVEFWGMFFICLWDVNLQQRVGEFEACFSYVCRMWIYGKEWFHMFTGHKFLMMSRCFKVYFSYIYRGMFFICLWGGMNFRQRKREMISKIKKKNVTFVTLVTLVIYFVRNTHFMCPIDFREERKVASKQLQRWASPTVAEAHRRSSK